MTEVKIEAIWSFAKS